MTKAAVILLLLRCLNGEQEFCQPGADAAREHPDLSEFTAMLEEHL